MTERDPIQTLWASQQIEGFTMSVEEIRRRASRLQTNVQRRNVGEYAVGGALIVVFTAAAFFAESTLGKIGCALTAAGVAVVMWRLAVVARAASAHDVLAAESWAIFYRSELVRQRDALASIWGWYLGPLVPGMVVYWLSIALKPGADVSDGVIATAGLGATAIVFALVASANKRAAAVLQAEIDALDQTNNS